MQAMLTSLQIHVTPPNPAWPAMFEREAQCIRAALKPLDADVHHIGSTAIRGIYAKPIIDMLLTVQSLSSLDARANAMRELGYEVMGEFGIAGRRYFRKDSPHGVRTHHVHTFERGSAGALRHLAFRDYMNAHPDAAQAYSALKQQLAATCAHSMEAYMDGKDTFVKQHEALALAWHEGKQSAE
jgi:GrpB-like predicted nucleotidyltransferase (UPF0157 family)